VPGRAIAPAATAAVTPNKASSLVSTPRGYPRDVAD
jgi:hypothetical protein